MSFGQASGPPASAKQVAYLRSLVEQAGYESFREARHPLGLTQRQAGGKFTSREASTLIDQLLAGAGDGADGDEGGDGQADPATSPSRPRSAAAERRAQAAAERLETERTEAVRGMPAEVLAAELERRGWATSPPDQR
jgi:hypothetical protein